MTATRDYYDVLGITRSAGDDEVKRAYRHLAMKYHPDRNRGDKTAEKKFKDISAAYDILKDPQTLYSCWSPEHSSNIKETVGHIKLNGCAGSVTFTFSNKNIEID